jgi:hypothetical protein
MSNHFVLGIIKERAGQPRISDRHLQVEAIEEMANTVPVCGLGISNLTTTVLRSKLRSVPERLVSLSHTEVSIRIGML